MDSPRDLINEKGFYIAKNVIPQETIQRVVQDMHLAVGQQLKFLGLNGSAVANRDTLLADLQTLYAKDLQRYLATLRLCAKLMSVYQTYLAADLIKMTKELGIEMPLFQTQPVVHVMAESLRIKDGYFGVGAHQDWPALQSGLDTLTCWIPLFPVRKNQFTLELIPGSHLLGFVDAKEEQHIHEVNPEVYKGMPFYAAELDAGDALLFSTFLIHKSELSGTPDAFRVALSMRYENGTGGNFIKRGYPTAQKRVVERTLADKDVPSKEEVLAIYRKN